MGRWPKHDFTQSGCIANRDVASIGFASCLISAVLEMRRNENALMLTRFSTVCASSTLWHKLIRRCMNACLFYARPNCGTACSPQTFAQACEVLSLCYLM